MGAGCHPLCFEPGVTGILQTSRRHEARAGWQSESCTVRHLRRLRAEPRSTRGLRIKEPRASPLFLDPGGMRARVQPWLPPQALLAVLPLLPLRSFLHTGADAGVLATAAPSVWNMAGKSRSMASVVNTAHSNSPTSPPMMC